MPSVDDILVVLENGRWHDLRSLAETLHLDDAKARAVVQFLEEYRFVRINTATNGVRLGEDLATLFQRLRQLE